MRHFILFIALASSYFVEWIPNNATAPTQPASSSEGEWPWQL